MIASRPTYVLIVCLSLASAGVERCAAQVASPAETLDKAIAEATAYLKSAIGPDGRCKGEYPADHPKFGVATAACVYALQTAEPTAGDQAVNRAIDWLGSAELTATYAVAMRAHAMASVPHSRALPVLERDVLWLIDAADKSGGYSSKSLNGRRGERIDNFHTELAALAVAAAAERGAAGEARPRRTLRRVRSGRY